VSNKGKILLQIQHFHGCPNSSELISQVRKAISEIENEIEYQEILIETNELAEEVKFRGSPTLLINGEDFEGREEPESASLNCRYYQNGLPSVEDIKARIQNLK
jgi:protein-disulfide isomerase